MQKQSFGKAIFFLTCFALLAAGCRGTSSAKIQAASPELAAGPAAVKETATATAVLPPAAAPTASPLPPLEPSSPPPSPEPTRTPIPAAETSQPGQQSCADAMIFVEDVTIPDFSVLSPAQTFLKTWRIQNTGSCTWGPGYNLSFMNGTLMAASTTLPVPKVNPGEDVDLTVSMTAPQEAGGYTGNWQLLDPRGQPVPVTGSDQNYIWIKVKVSAPMAVNQPTPTPSATTTANQQNSLASSKAASGCASVPDGAFENAVLALINQERASRNLPPLKREARLDTAALQHSLDMSCNNFVEHYGSSGSTWFTRITKAGYTYQYASENIAAGNPAFGGDANWVVETRWMNSQVHRENILNPKVTEIGIAYVFNSAAQWGGYTTVDFALP